MTIEEQIIQILIALGNNGIQALIDSLRSLPGIG